MSTVCEQYSEGEWKPNSTHKELSLRKSKHQDMGLNLGGSKERKIIRKEQ